MVSTRRYIALEIDEHMTPLICQRQDIICLKSKLYIYNGVKFLIQSRYFG